MPLDIINYEFSRGSLLTPLRRSTVGVRCALVWWHIIIMCLHTLMKRPATSHCYYYYCYCYCNVFPKRSNWNLRNNGYSFFFFFFSLSPSFYSRSTLERVRIHTHRKLYSLYVQQFWRRAWFIALSSSCLCHHSTQTLPLYNHFHANHECEPTNTEHAYMPPKFTNNSVDNFYKYVGLQLSPALGS